MDSPIERPGAEAPDFGLPASWVAPASTRSLEARFWKLCDALLTAPVRPRRGFVAHGLDVVRRRTKRFDRAAAALSLVDAVVPGTAAAWCTLATRRRKLPLRATELGLIAFGTGDTVYRLGHPHADMVLKIERISLGMRPAELAALARMRRDAFDDVLRQYGAVAEVFPRTRFLVVQSPLFGVPAVGALQPFVVGPLRDLLREIPETELQLLVSRRPPLRTQIVGFLERTIAAWERGGWIVDLGLHNLVLAGKGDDTRLAYLDVEMKEAAGIRGTFREVMYERLVQRMRVILDAIGSQGEAEGGLTSAASA